MTDDKDPENLTIRVLEQIRTRSDLRLQSRGLKDFEE